MGAVGGYKGVTCNCVGARDGVDCCHSKRKTIELCLAGRLLLRSSGSLTSHHQVFGVFWPSLNDGKQFSAKIINVINGGDRSMYLIIGSLNSQSHYQACLVCSGPVLTNI